MIMNSATLLSRKTALTSYDQGQQRLPTQKTAMERIGRLEAAAILGVSIRVYNTRCNGSRKRLRRPTPRVRAVQDPSRTSGSGTATRPC